jgi:hypothetical protein
MRTIIRPNSRTYLQLLSIVPAIALLAFADSPAANGAERHVRKYSDVRKHSDVQIGSSSYNPETRTFEMPWPFGPESNQQ